MQESRLIPNETILSSNLNSFVQDFQKRNFYQKLVPGLILGGENSLPFWTEFSQAISSALWLPTQIDSLDSGLNWLSGYAQRQNVNSWFSMSVETFRRNVSTAPNKNLFKICCPSSTASVFGFTDCENTSNKSSKRYKKTTRHSKSKKLTKLPPNSVLKIRVYPCLELHKVWKQWLAGYRRIYNWAIDKLKTGFTGELQKEFLLDKSIPAWVQAIPSHPKQEACDEAFDAYRQAKANGGTPRFKSCLAKSQAIQFKAKDFLHGTWFPRITKGLTFKASQPIPQECEYGTELIYQRRKWYACIPRAISPIATGSTRCIALEPGNRAFLTGYDGENVLENESYTSKTCTNCGFIHHKLGSAKVFKCPECGHKHDRDWGGDRNIMIRALQATAFTVIGDAILFRNAEF